MKLRTMLPNMTPNLNDTLDDIGEIHKMIRERARVNKTTYTSAHFLIEDSSSEININGGLIKSRRM